MVASADLMQRKKQKPCNLEQPGALKPATMVFNNQMQQLVQQTLAQRHTGHHECIRDEKYFFTTFFKVQVAFMNNVIRNNQILTTNLSL
jgi:hypothetical protein